MARARNIKPAIMDNESLADMSPLTRLLFIYLWMLADREGRLEDRPKRIAAQALPYDRSADVEAMLNELHAAGFIVRYEAKGVACIQITSFTKHQAPHVREAASQLPAYEQDTEKAAPKHSLGSAEALPRSPDSLIEDSLIEDCGMAGAEAPSAQKRKPSARATALPDDFMPNETGLRYAAERSVKTESEIVRFKNHHTARGSTMKDWQAAWRTWCDKAVEFGRAGGGKSTGRHNGFDKMDYMSGVNDDGSFQ